MLYTEDVYKGHKKLTSVPIDEGMMRYLRQLQAQILWCV